MQSPTVGLVRYGRLNGDEWEIETVAELDDVRLGFTGARKLVSLELDSDGVPHLAYGDQDSIYYAERDGSDWHETTILQSDNSLYNGHVVLRLDEIDDAPTLVFWQPDQPGSGTVRIASPDFAEIQPGDANQDGEFNQLDLFLSLIHI